MVKKTDLASIFGFIDQNKPAYRHSNDKTNVVIKGANSPVVKFPPSICKYCNNTRTQPHDRAWESLLTYLRNRNPIIRSGDEIPLVEVFGGEVEQYMKCVQLYFVKQLGCHARNYEIPLPLNMFGACILANQAHPSVYLSIFDLSNDHTSAEIIVGDVTALGSKSLTNVACWPYVVGSLGIHVIYSVVDAPSLSKRTVWAPSRSSEALWMQ